MADIPHQYHPDIPFTEPPVDEMDTQPYEWTPPLQTPVATHQDHEQARRIMSEFITARRTLSSVEGEHYAAFAGMEEEPIEPDAQIAAERPLPLLARAAKWAGQTLTAWAERQAS